jgi:hypothetical protein
MAARLLASRQIDTRLLTALGLFLLSAGCVRSPEREQAPVSKPQAQMEVARLLPGVWKLQTVDGAPAKGWLIFRDSERGGLFTFSLV